jgi:hypothetical protein
MEQQGFDGEGYSHEEFLGTMEALGEPAGGTPRSWMRRRTAAAAAVGVAVALGAGGYGIAVAASGSSAAAAGTSVLPAADTSSNPNGGNAGPGCGGAFMRGGFSGTLKSDNGSTLTVQSAAPAPANVTRTVTTSSSTLAVRIASGSLADVANGAQVLVGGSFANNTLTAKTIVTGSGLTPGTGRTPAGAANWSGSGFASGTVADKTASGFTVVAANGARVTVATSSSPTVQTALKISVSALRVGQRVAVSGAPAANNAITATQVEELDTTAVSPDLGIGPGFGPGFGFGSRGGHGRAGAPTALPSNAPTSPPEGAVPPKGPGGFRGHGGPFGSCGTATATPPAALTNPGA